MRSNKMVKELEGECSDTMTKKSKKGNESVHHQSVRDCMIDWIECWIYPIWCDMRLSVPKVKPTSWTPFRYKDWPRWDIWEPYHPAAWGPAHAHCMWCVQESRCSINDQFWREQHQILGSRICLTTLRYGKDVTRNKTGCHIFIFE